MNNHRNLKNPQVINNDKRLLQGKLAKNPKI
jgi:hypothetical protein